MFTVFSFKKIDDKDLLRDVIYHLGPTIEDTINNVLYNFPEKYKNIVRLHSSDTELRSFMDEIILSTYNELRTTEDLLNKWDIYRKAFRKIKTFFISLIKKELALND